MDNSEPSPIKDVVTPIKDRVKMARAKHEETQRMKLHELQEQAVQAQLQREKLDQERRLRHKMKEDERRQQVEERKRAIWEASMSRREAIIQRDKERQDKIEKAKQARYRDSERKFAFGSSTPRTFNLDALRFNWGARRIEPKSKLDLRATSTLNVMTASTSQPGINTGSSLVINVTEFEKDENDRPRIPSSVARRRTDLLPTVPLRQPGRAYSMTRLDKIPHQRPLHSTSPSMHHLNRTQCRSGDTSPSSRPGSALSGTPPLRRPTTARRPRPISIAGTGVNTPKGAIDSGNTTAAGTPVVSRDNTLLQSQQETVTRRAGSPRKPRPVSAHAIKTTLNPTVDHKPPIQKREKMLHATSLPMSPRANSPAARFSTGQKQKHAYRASDINTLGHGKNHVNPVEVTQKLEKLQKKRNDVSETADGHNVKEKSTQAKDVKKIMDAATDAGGDSQPVELKSATREGSPEKKEEDVMTASMTARRITTEEEAKAALAERRRKAREELERQAELEKQRLKEEEEAEARRQQEEEARLRKEEEEALQLARLQRQEEEEKLQRAIEAQQKAEREEAERLAREEKERQARLIEEEEKRKAAEEAERKRQEESEKEEKERLLRKQRVEAIMARTRLKKQAIQAEEDKKEQELNQSSQTDTKDIAVEVKNTVAHSPASAQTDNGNWSSDDLKFGTSQMEQSHEEEVLPNKQVDNSPNANTNNVPAPVSNNGNLPHALDSNVGHNISADFIQTERLSSEHNQKENLKLREDEFSAHNGHGTAHDNTLLTLQN